MYSPYDIVSYKITLESIQVQNVLHIRAPEYIIDAFLDAVFGRARPQSTLYMPRCYWFEYSVWIFS